MKKKRRKSFVRTVKKVIDGDTIEVNRKINGTRIIRLAGIDAPELYQFGGRKAQNTLRRLIEGKRIRVTPVGRDSYGRIVAIIRKNRKSINKIMREMGY